MKLYYLKGACPLVIQIMLEWIDQPYDLEEVTYVEMKSPDFLALNPAGAVPVFTDGDLVLTQCGAILEYLNEKFPGSGLVGDTLIERAETRRWLNFCNGDVHRTMSMLFGVEAYSSDPAIQKLLIDKTIERLMMLFAIAEKQLEGKTWLTGKRSVADIYLYVILTWTQMQNLDMSNFPNLMGLLQHMSADKGVQVAREKQGLPN